MYTFYYCRQLKRDRWRDELARTPRPDTVTDDQKVFSVRLEPLLIRRIKVHAVLVDRSIRSVVTEAVEEYLERHKDEKDAL